MCPHHNEISENVKWSGWEETIFTHDLFHWAPVLTYFHHQYNGIQEDERDDEFREDGTCFLLRKHTEEYFVICAAEITRTAVSI